MGDHAARMPTVDQDWQPFSEQVCHKDWVGQSKGCTSSCQRERALWSCRFDCPANKFTMVQTDCTEEFVPIDTTHTFTGVIVPGEGDQVEFVLDRMVGPRCPGGEVVPPDDSWCLKGRIRLGENGVLQAMVQTADSMEAEMFAGAQPPHSQTPILMSCHT